MKQLWKSFALVFAVFVGMTLAAVTGAVSTADAHTGTPSPTTWSSNTILTAQSLNDTIAHLHNTFSAGIVDAHISTSAAIAHTKLATPALVAKAVLSTTTACAGAGAAGTDCTVGVEHSKFFATSGGAGAGNSALEAAGVAGTYTLTLSYTPTNANFMVLVTAAAATEYCAVTLRQAAAPQIRIECRTDASALTDANFSIVVFDTD